MNIFKKLITAIRAIFSEAGEAVVDTQATRIMEQELRDAKDQLSIAKAGLTDIIAEQTTVRRQVKTLDKSISEHENYVMQALAKNDESLALDIAAKIADLINEKDALVVVEIGYSADVASLKTEINKAGRKIHDLDRELAVIKTTESVLKANEVITEDVYGTESYLAAATESLQRVKTRQQKRADKMEAALEIQSAENGLNAKLEQASIIKSGETGASILAKMKIKQAEAKS